MIRIHLQDLGSNLAVGISGNDKREIEYQYYSFYNLKATNGDLIWINDFGPNRFMAYFWTSVERFEKWLKNSSARIFENNRKKKCKVRESIKEIKEITKKRREEILYDQFVPIQSCPTLDIYNAPCIDLNTLQLAINIE